MRLLILEYLHILAVNVYGWTISFSFSQKLENASIDESVYDFQDSGTAVPGPRLDEWHGYDGIGVEFLEYGHARIGKWFSECVDFLHVPIALLGYHPGYLDGLGCRFDHAVEKEVKPSDHVAVVVSR